VPALGGIKARIRQNKDSRTMNRNVLYLVIGALAVAAVVTGYLLYQEQQKTSGIELNLNKNGVSIETK
jgi:flagellar biosynthesis/type III secretory pathway M-ring protein FliF/YscJ